VERVFDLEPLTFRDAQANDMLDCFDFTEPPRPPLVLKERPAHAHPVPESAYVA
jgi:hypothetical protein